MSLNIFVTISNNKIIPIMNTNIVMAILIIPIILIIMKTYLSGGEVLANNVGTRYVHHVQTAEKKYIMCVHNVGIQCGYKMCVHNVGTKCG